jgi:hypothetical protein
MIVMKVRGEEIEIRIPNLRNDNGPPGIIEEFIGGVIEEKGFFGKLDNKTVVKDVSDFDLHE